MKNKKARLWMRTAILIVFVAAVIFTLYQAFGTSKGVAEGDTAKDFQLKKLNGKTVHLKDLRGKGVMLNFWGSWCEPCKEEMPYLNAVYQQHMKGVTILGINDGESKLAVKNFVDRNDIKFPILLDSDTSVTNGYDIGPIPTTYLIDENGQVIRKIEGQMANPGVVKKMLKRIQPDRYK